MRPSIWNRCGQWTWTFLSPFVQRQLFFRAMHLTLVGYRRISKSRWFAVSSADWSGGSSESRFGKPAIRKAPERQKSTRVKCIALLFFSLTTIKTFVSPTSVFGFSSSLKEREKINQGLVGAVGNSVPRFLRRRVFQRACENVGNLLFGFPHFHSAGSFHRPVFPQSCRSFLIAGSLFFLVRGVSKVGPTRDLLL